MLDFPFADESTTEDVLTNPVYSLKNDKWITAKSQGDKMIRPFVPTLIKEKTISNGYTLVAQRVISYGLSSYGYDIRLSPKDFKVFRHIPGTVVDPKNFNPANLESVPLHSGKDGDYFILPAHSYGLGVALEHLTIPNNISVVCIGKSTYARVGLIANLTPIEASWEGHLTLEFSNSSGADCRIYANEGIAQLLFFEGEPCKTSYADRNGKYQGQEHEVTLARV